MTHLHLNAFLMTTGHHEASWRLPESDPLASLDIEHYGLPRPANQYQTRDTERTVV
jgi:hypothetical protein